MSNYIYFLKLSETINEWNEKLSSLFNSENGITYGIILIVVVFVIAILGVNTLNKK